MTWAEPEGRGRRRTVPTTRIFPRAVFVFFCPGFDAAAKHAVRRSAAAEWVIRYGSGVHRHAQCVRRVRACARLGALGRLRDVSETSCAAFEGVSRGGLESYSNFGLRSRGVLPTIAQREPVSSLLLERRLATPDSSCSDCSAYRLRAIAQGSGEQSHPSQTRRARTN